MRDKYIIDVDTGVDDAQALMLALSQPHFDIVAITCVSGNVHVDQVCLNTLKVLSVCNRLDVPVFKGCDKALLGVSIDATHYHGYDGLGDANLDISVSMDQVQKEHAASALIRLTKEFPGEINLVALAPLTNIALAIRQDSEIGKRFKSVTVMGGNTQGRGNSTVCGEFNFSCDPDAAYVVLNEMNRHITMSPWEVNLTSATGQPWEWFDKWIETDTAKGRFNKAIIQKALHTQREVKKMPIFRSCDMNAMVLVVDKSIVTSTEDVFATVELQGKYTRGMMVVDWNKRLGKEPNVTLINSLDTARARPYFEKML